MDPDWRPSHAYVPGRSPRHPEGLFDPLKADVSGASLSDLHRTRAFAAGLGFLADGFFWEAHEVLEAVWMACPEGSAERLLVQGLIQGANASLKARMDRPKAQARLEDMARDLIDAAFAGGVKVILGLSYDSAMRSVFLQNSAQ